jgi:acyl-CoA oxidase
MANLLQKERQQETLDINKVNAFLDPDHETTQAIFKQLVNDPILVTPRNYYDLTKPELRELAVKKIQRLTSYIEIDGATNFENRLSLLSISDPSLATRVGINLALFCNAIRGNGTDEQINYWLVERGTLQIKDIYGCFAMTELGHGSNVANLQTTATYNPEKQTFTLNTPELAATKWWIGGAAHSSNHAVVYARLISKGKDYGVKTFVAQLRDSNFDLLPGVTIGDIGSKMGRDAIDNGWIQFNNVEIPKDYMLQKFTSIDADGTVDVTPLEQLSYSALLQGRVSMVLDSHRHGARFITIPLRYAISRQQFGDPENENQIINYSLHQYRLVPYLALVYLLAPAARKLCQDYDTILSDLYKGTNIKKTIFDLKNLFVDSASLKASNTWLVSQLIDEARQACGGHGYHAYSGLGRAFADWSVQQTWEGDNNVLSINAGRSIIKYYEGAVQGKKQGENFQYLAQEFKGDDVLNFTDLKSYVDIWSAIITRVAKHALKIANGDWDSVSQERLILSKFHSNRYLLDTFLERLNSGVVSGEEAKVLTSLFKLYSLFFIDKYSGTFLQFNLINSSTLTSIQAETKILLSEIRPHLVGLTDAFKYPDEIINSSLGNFDGNFYTNYFDDVTRNNGKGTKPPYLDLLNATLGRDDKDQRLSNSRSKDVLEKLAP